MKRGRTEGSCPHFNAALSAVDYGNIIIQHGARITPSASYACCACGQLVSNMYGIGSDTDVAVGKLLRGCACGSVMLVDIVRSELYCCNCNDYVYHPTFDEGRQLCHVARRYIDRGLQPGIPHHDPGPEVCAKRVRVAKVVKASAPQVPSQADAMMPSAPACLLRDDAAEQKANQLPVPQAELDVIRGSKPAGSCSEVAPDGFPAGLRGLNNLGNTCFMNSVLQVFIHSPLMRNYFLGQGHSQSVCSRLGKSPGGACLSCELDAVFTAAYSGERAPLSPTDFLYSWWTFADSLAGYRQQDAHEFYLSTLSGLGDAMITEPGLAHATASPGSGAGQRAARSAGPGMAVSPGGQEAVTLVSPLPAAAASSHSRQPVGGEESPPGLSVAGGSSMNPCRDLQPAAATATAMADGTSAAHPDVGNGLSLVDAVFGGVLRSDVTCSVCGHTSTAYDPFLDISLDMVNVFSGPPHLPYMHVSRQPLSESTPASSPTLMPKLAALEEDETEAEGGSRGAAAAAAAAAARPSASTCGGHSSLSALSIPSPSPSPSGVTGTALVMEEHGYGAGDEAHQGRSQQEVCASPSTGSGSAPNGDEDAGFVGRCEEAAAAGDEGTRHRKDLSTDSDNSCGPSPESRASLPPLDAGGTAAELSTGHVPHPRHSEAEIASGSQPRASGQANSAVATAAAAAAAVATPGHHSSKPTGALATAAVAAGGGLARTTSDSMAAAESAADGGGGGGCQAELAESPGNPDDCITSPGQMQMTGPQHAGQLGRSEEPGRNLRAATTAAAVAAGPWRCDYEGGCELGSRGATPGASASVVEGTTAGGLHSPEEDGEVLLTQGSAAPQEGVEPQPSCDGGRGGTSAGAPGRATRRRGRGGRGRRGGAGGRTMVAGAGDASGGKRGVAVAQMGQKGASASQMVDPQLTTRPQGANNAEAGQGAQGVAGHATLHGCLRHFVTPERLSAGEAWVCSACKRRQPAVKQLSIRRLPPVLALHVKRFEHRHHHHQPHQPSQPQQHYTAFNAAQGAPGSYDPEALYGATAPGGPIHGAGGGGGGGGGGGSTAAASSRPGRHAARKIQTQLQFPISLDLAPYTTPAILRARYGMRSGQAAAAAAATEAVEVKGAPPSGGEPGGAVTSTVEGGGSGGGGGSNDEARVGPIPIPSCRYHLFAVISHKGDLSGGHYVVFVRPGGSVGPGGSWFQCDDAWVSAVSEEDVMACQAYMMFYSAEL